jgi:hypothetical protein
MPLKTLVVIALRLYAIYWLVSALPAMVAYLPFMWDAASSTTTNGLASSFIFIPPAMLVFAVVLWFLASWLSSGVTKGHDTQVTFDSLTREDLYHFAFVFLGLFFALSSLLSVVETAHQFFAFDLPQPDSNPEKGRYLWPFLGHALTMIAGLACVFGARKWTNKLIRLENKHEAPPPAV